MLGQDAKGFFATDCEPVEPGASELVCWYSIPAGCELERTSVTVEAGDGCVDSERITGRDYGFAVGFHFFSIDT